MPRKQNVYGEGNYEATRKYNDATKKFVESGRVDRAARDAKPKSSAEAAEMKQAEEAGLRRAKDKEPPVKEPPTPRPAVKEPDRGQKQTDGKRPNPPAGRGPGQR